MLFVKDHNKLCDSNIFSLVYKGLQTIPVYCTQRVGVVLLNTLLQLGKKNKHARLIFLSHFRLFVMFVLSSLVVVVVTFITHSTIIVIVSACFGFILSWDIFGFALQLRVKLNGSNMMKPMTLCKFKETIIFIIMFFLTAVISGVSSHLSSSSSSEIFQSFLYVFLVLLVLLKVLGDVQAVSIIFGLFRNPIYPASIESTRIFSKKKRILKYVGLIHWALLVYGEQSML